MVGPYDANWLEFLITDILAGITVALTLIPQGKEPAIYYILFYSILFYSVESQGTGFIIGQFYFLNSCRATSHHIAWHLVQSFSAVCF